jgi:NADPH2:quinone reductase
VRLHVSGVNPRDVRQRQETKTLAEPIIPHSDGAGVIDRVGDDMDPAQVGRRVWVFNAQWRRPHGTAADYIVLPQELVVDLPDTTSFDLGACLGTPALTAAVAVNRLGELNGAKVLVTGGGSSVGAFAVRFACGLGAEVFATASLRRSERAAAAGAAVVVNRDAQDLAQRIRQMAGRGVDYVIDLDLAALIPLLSQGVIAHRGKVISYGSHIQGPIGVPFDTLLSRALTIQVFGVHAIDAAERAAALRLISSCVDAGKLGDTVGAAFDLDEIAAAHQAVESGAIAGQVLLRLR